LRATHLTYVLAGVSSPPGTDDKRTLGIAFHKLEICPAHVVEPLGTRDAMLNLAAPADNLLVLSKAVRPRKERAPNGGGEAVTGLAD